PTSEGWSSLSSPALHGAAVVVGGKIYAVGGGSAPNLEEYDPAPNRWQTRTNMLTGRVSLSAAAIGGKVYAFGGSAGASTAKNEEYNVGISTRLTNLTPNTLYTFQAWSRNRMAADNSVSVTLSTYTLANLPVLYSSGSYDTVSSNGLLISWKANSNPAGTEYYVDISSMGNFSSTASGNKNTGWITHISTNVSGLSAGATYYARVKARNVDKVQTSTYTALGSTVTTTDIEVPTNIYFDDVTSATITASAYTPSPGFIDLSVGQRAVRIAKDGTYGSWRGGNTWTARASFTPLINEGQGAGFRGKFYLLSNDAVLNIYDPVSDSWSTSAGLPTGRVAGFSLAATHNALYAIGGENATNSKVNEEYDPAADAWTTRAPLLTGRQNITAAGLGTKIYVAYDPAANSWATRSSADVNSPNGHGASVGAKLYIAGAGAGASPTGLREYDVVSDTWVVRASMTNGRAKPGVAALNGKIYAAGGFGIDDGNLGEYDPGTASTYTALTPNTLYTFKAQARDSNGNVTAETLNVTTYTWAGLPGTISSHTFSGVAASSFTISWTSSGNPTSTQYQVQISTAITFDGVDDKTGGYAVMLSSQFTGLSTGLIYFARVKARNDLMVETTGYRLLGSTQTAANFTAPGAASPLITAVTTTSFKI
ncbi:MAG: fibronectin type III domain-containing protein, partial [Halothiobacillaceae bacterium]